VEPEHEEEGKREHVHGTNWNRAVGRRRTITGTRTKPEPEPEPEPDEEGG